MVRVCVVGAKSTGSTTLARSLAAAYATVWVPEYGRDYTPEKYTIGTGDRGLPSDFLRIALEQNARRIGWPRGAGRDPVPRHGRARDGSVGGGLPGCHVGRRLASGGGARESLLALPATDDVGVAWADDGLRLGDDTGHG